MTPLWLMSLKEGVMTIDSLNMARFKGDQPQLVKAK